MLFQCSELKKTEKKLKKSNAIPETCWRCKSSGGCMICEPQCITSLCGCLWVRFHMSIAPVYGCQYFFVVYVCKNIAFVNFQ